MKLLEQAFIELFPDKNFEEYDLKIKYTDKFKPYNANVRYTKNSLQFNLSKRWRKVSKEMQIGLIQGLMLRIFKEKKNTTNIDLYNSFMRNLHISIPKTDSDPLLENSFNLVNEKYFFGLMEGPNLVWHNSIRRLGSYEYGTDTISISRVLLQDKGLLDYVMYHEMLHKKHKFHSNNGRTHHHTHEFKEMEKKFNKSEEMEERIKKLVRRMLKDVIEKGNVELDYTNKHNLNTWKQLNQMLGVAKDRWTWGTTEFTYAFYLANNSSLKDFRKTNLILIFNDKKLFNPIRGYERTAYVLKNGVENFRKALIGLVLITFN